MNTWRKLRLAAITLGLALGLGGEVNAQYPPAGGYPPMMPVGHHGEPTPIAGPSFPAFPISPTTPPPPPHGAPPELPGWMCGAFDDCSNCWSQPDTRHYVTVDLLTVRPTHDRNPAFNTRLIDPPAGPRTTDFNDFNWAVIPRINLNLQVTPFWGARVSWWQLFRQRDDIFLTNDDPNRIISSVEPLRHFRMDSPETFFFLSQLPTQTQDTPPQPLGPFPLRSSMDMGVPDVLNFSTELRMLVWDIEMTRYVELGDTYGAVNLGIRYAYLSQNYLAQRSNRGGTQQTVGWDPFISLDDDAALTVMADNRSIFYGHNFRGTGPKFGMELAFPLGDWIKLYGTANGSILFGSRRENAFIWGQQEAQIFDIDGNVTDTLDFSNTIAAHQRRSVFTVVPVGEVETGFSFQLGNNVVSPLLKVGFVGQAWLNAGNATNPNANLFLYGVNASVGFGF